MSKMSIKLKTRETCLQFGSETRHSVPNITWGSFRGQREYKWGSFGGRDHFGVKLGIILVSGSFWGLYKPLPEATPNMAAIRGSHFVTRVVCVLTS